MSIALRLLINCKSQKAETSGEERNNNTYGQVGYTTYRAIDYDILAYHTKVKIDCLQLVSPFRTSSVRRTPCAPIRTVISRYHTLKYCHIH